MVKRTSFRQNAVAEVGTHQFQQNGCREGKRRWVWVTCSAKCPEKAPRKTSTCSLPLPSLPLRDGTRFCSSKPPIL